MFVRIYHKNYRQYYYWDCWVYHFHQFMLMSVLVWWMELFVVLLKDIWEN